jgi:hypothetical protein
MESLLVVTGPPGLESQQWRAGRYASGATAHHREAKPSLAAQGRCGFTITGEDSGYANGRGQIVEE